MRIFSRLGAFSCGLVLFWGGLATCLRAQEGGELFLNLTASTMDGRVITDLTLEELRITVDGEDVLLMNLIEPDAPFNIGLLMDVSPSKDREVDLIRQATSDFVSYFSLHDRIMVLTFDNEVYVDCDWTTDRKKVDEAIWEYGLDKPGGSTILYEAVVAATEQKFSERMPRTAMIVFTDGVDTGSKTVEEDDSLEYMRGARVVTYPVQHFSESCDMGVHDPAPSQPDLNRLPGPQGTEIGGIFVGRGGSERDWAEYKVRKIREGAAAYLGNLARASGGEHFLLASINELPAAYRRIATELTDVYTVGFAPPGRSLPGKYRQVRATCSREGVILTYRPRGYWQEQP